MKKVFLMLVAVATVALVSCGGSKEEKKATTDGAAKTEKALGEACTAVGEAIGTVGVSLGMDASDIEQLQKMLDK